MVASLQQFFLGIQMSEIVAIVGAGTMGSGIAQAATVSGFDAVLIDVNDTALEKAHASLMQSLDRLVAKGKLDVSTRHAALSRLRLSTDYQQLASAHITIEAASESIALKTQLLTRIESVVRSDSIIATNTSSISITLLGAALSHPSRFVGMHFFNPVALMPLVEVIRGLHTTDATADYVRQFAAFLGKSAILVKNSPGFVVNRILVPMINEAFCLLAEHTASAKEIDDGMKLGANHPIGPLALGDLIGLDVCLAVMDVLYEDFRDPKYRPCPLLREYVAAGWLGRKTQRGVFPYKD
jgi:3-hydroxybutyryl-CoA dehydrogenase